MSLELTLHTTPEVPFEAPAICPDKIITLSERELLSLPAHHGNQQVTLGDFFSAKGNTNGELHLLGDLGRIKHVATGMTSGHLHIHGNIGSHLGAGMSGGQITVEGNTGDWLGPEMTGGRITVNGNTGHLVGSAYRGSSIGMRGGEIFIHGNTRNETGHAMRNGLIVVTGNSGDFTGVNMLAGNIVVLGDMGIRNGAGMKRGTIITLQPVEILPTFSYGCTYQPLFLPMLFTYLGKQGFKIEDKYVNGKYERWSGDSVELNKGEILVYKS